MSETPATPEAPADAAPEANKQQQETFSREYVESLRQEAASARVAKKDAAEEARQEVVKEYEPKLAEKDTAYAELATTHKVTSTELSRLKAVIAAEIPTADIFNVAGLVQGDTDESISESVERVKAIYGKSPAKDRPVDPSQGQGSHIPLNGQPVLDMLKRAVCA